MSGYKFGTNITRAESTTLVCYIVQKTHTFWERQKNSTHAILIKNYILIKVSYKELNQKYRQTYWPTQL